MCNKKSDPYALKSACKDCPFRKDTGYLSGERIRQIINYMDKDDALFPCHKTVNTELREEYNQVMSEIEDILTDAQTEQERTALRAELEIKYNLKELEERVLLSIQKEEKICAGWLILGKKENIVFNNLPLRLAAMTNRLSLDQFKDEDVIFDSIEEAIKAHS